MKKILSIVALAIALTSFGQGVKQNFWDTNSGYGNTANTPSRVR